MQWFGDRLLIFCAILRKRKYIESLRGVSCAAGNIMSNDCFSRSLWRTQPAI